MKRSSEVLTKIIKFLLRSQRFVKFVKISSKVRYVRQKFVKFVRSSSNSSEAWVEVLIGSQNNLFLWFWWAKQLILFDLEGKTVYFVVIKWDLTNLINFWRTWRTSDELLTKFWRTRRTSDELGEPLRNLTNFWRCSEVSAFSSCSLLFCQSASLKTSVGSDNTHTHMHCRSDRIVGSFRLSVTHTRLNSIWQPWLHHSKT